MAGVHAAIDIGTNSVHLLVARVDAEGGFEILTREKESVRLGSGSNNMVNPPADAVDRTIDALVRYRGLAETYGAEVHAVATSAVREAADRDGIVRRFRAEAGVDVEVISGVEEARLIHLGAIQAVPVFDQQIVLVDIGGGSTELLVGREAAVLGARSVKLGAIRLTDRFFPNGIVGKRSVVQCRRYIDSYLSSVARDIKILGFDVGVGCSGTIATVAEIIEFQKGREPGRWVNNVEITHRDVIDVVDVLIAARRPQDRVSIPGLDARRADIIVAGAVLLERIFDLVGIETMLISEYALREGVLLDRSQPEGSGFHHLSDIRRTSVLRVADSFLEDRAHVERATDLALALFDELAELHGLGIDERDLLEAAGLLHNVGLFISHGAHHKHSYYVIRNSDSLLGFTEREIGLIALTARYHRKSDPKPTHPEFAALDDEDQRRVWVLGGLLRVAIGLDRTRSSSIESVACKIGAKSVKIEAAVADSADADLELYSAQERSGMLAKALDRSVRICLA